MDTKQYLSQIGIYDQTIKDKKSELLQYRIYAYGLSAISNEERVQSSPTFDKMTNKIIKIMEMESQIDDLSDESEDLKKEILKTIGMLKSITHRKILFKKYFENKSIYSIAKELKMTDRGCKKAHKKALQEFEKIKHNI